MKIARPKRKNIIASCVAVLLCVLLILIWYPSLWQTLQFRIDSSGWPYGENGFRQNLLQTIGGLLLLIAALMTWRNLQVAQRNLQLTEGKQLTDRFSKAIEQLGSRAIEVRLGGIYSLERIARDSVEEHWVIMEVMTAFVREKSPIRQYHGRPGKENLLSKLPTDIQAALTVIGRRNTIQDPHDKWIDLRNAQLMRADLREADLGRADLRGTNLRGADLSGADLKAVDFSRACLLAADLKGTNLRTANLREADLRGSNLAIADFREVDLGGAKLIGADLTGIDLREADLRGADLRGAKLIKADLRKSNLAKADLSGAYLVSTDLRDAHLLKTDLRWATLKGVQGLDSSQIRLARK